ncbi:hypothetical protein Q5P01_009279 [Channa striata]|uniref:Uncharacterized protein n=1 Tax=Channa striata TaxID=64152 RepID=A0AA88N295_CHASR|nr:hypothetical protein Q5P01_009279 [Channa striata]
MSSVPYRLTPERTPHTSLLPVAPGESAAALPQSASRLPDVAAVAGGLCSRWLSCVEAFHSRTDLSFSTVQHSSIRPSDIINVWPHITAHTFLLPSFLTRSTQTKPQSHRRQLLLQHNT